MKHPPMKLVNLSAVSIIAIVLLGITAAAGLQSHTSAPTQSQTPSNNQPTNQTEFDETQFPIVEEYNLETKNNEERHAISLKAKKYRMSMPAISNPNIKVAVNVTSWPQDFSALPVAESTTILLGEVTEARANLSEDKEAVFSDFTIKPITVFKDTSNAVKNNSSLTTSRYGGKVKFQDGNTLLVFKTGLGMPRVGRQYLFFIDQTDTGSELLTAYEIRQGKAVPLDSGTPNFDAYNNVTQSTLLRDLKQKIETFR